MIAHLRGTAHKLKIGLLIVDVRGVGYLVSVPIDFWDNVEEGKDISLHIFTYIKEDRLDLYGFSDLSGRTLFEETTKISGIGPSLGLELCTVPRSLLVQAITCQDPGILTNIKGIGRKKAEKLLLDLKSVMENQPAIFYAASATMNLMAEYDQDAVSALTALGYDRSTAIHALKGLSGDMKTTEQRVEAALRSL
ncbi:MAG: Holliday junction ATP-dependent DNA helicase RuvA [bacterium]|nr:Holliday junction ATP-dependent DNA helicase RuvA [bacterium]